MSTRISRSLPLERLVVAVIVLAGSRLPAAMAAPPPLLLPLETRYAQTLEGLTLTGSYRYFTDMELQEADRFDGWSLDLDLSLPLNDRFQLWLSLPVYTRGQARLTNPGQPDTGREIDIKGNGGVYNFTTLNFEHQLGFARDSGYNLGYYLGLGMVVDPLDTTTAKGDVYNHRGRMTQGGVKLDGTAWGDSIRWLGNFGLRWYWQTDDLSPSGDNFTYIDLKGAAIFPAWGEGVHPVIEATYLGDFGQYNALTLSPELILSLGPDLSLKAGIPVGLGGEGNQLGATAQFSYRF